MKQHIMIFFVIVISIGHIHADIWDEVKKSSLWKYPLIALEFTEINSRTMANDVKNSFGWVGAKDPYLYKTFQLKADTLQAAIAKKLANIPKAADEEYLNEVEVLVIEFKNGLNTLFNEAQKKMVPSDYEKFKTEMNLRKLDSAQQLTFVGFVGILSENWKKYGVPYFKAQLRKDNKYSALKASVKQDSRMIANEELYRSRRVPLVKRGEEKFLGIPHAQTKGISWGFVGSGGGNRAMILTLGYAKAAEDMGLLDACTYFSSLSGSSWFLGPWIIAGGTVNGYKDILLEMIKKNQFSLSQTQGSLGISNFVNDIIWPKFVFGEPLNSVDIYGALLARTLFARLADKSQKQHLAQQWINIQDGSKPLPIYTAVSMHKEGLQARYNWYEFNPLEVRNLDYDLSIPAYSFNWTFSSGTSLESAPEESFGYILGICGSAYAINLKDLAHILLVDAKKKQGTEVILDKIKYEVLTKLLDEVIFKDTIIGFKRVSPAQINNPFKGLTTKLDSKGSWLKDRSYITLVDAGIDYNIPGLPLLRADRKVRVIVIGDSSSNVESTLELQKFLKDAERYYREHDNKIVSFERVDDRTNKTLQLYKDTKNDDAPRIIYINFLKDETLMRSAQNDPSLKKIIQDYKLDTFQPEKCVATGFCSTFNFDYTAEQFLQLSGMAEFNMKANRKMIADFVKAELYSNTIKK